MDGGGGGQVTARQVRQIEEGEMGGKRDRYREDTEGQTLKRDG